MLASNAPILIPKPWAVSASGSYITNPIPSASQIGVLNGAASWTDGFVPLNMTPVNAGGIPPRGPDINGVLNTLSAVAQWGQYGGLAVYGSAASAAGYPQGACVLSATDSQIYWQATTDGNTTNPDTGGAGWRNFKFGGLTAISFSAQAATYTVTNIQAAHSIISLAGSAVSNFTLALPIAAGQWTIYNAVTGGYTITTTAGSGASVPLVLGSQAVWADGAGNLYPVTTPISQATTSVSGIAKLATISECVTGTNNTDIVTPAGLAAAIASAPKINLFSSSGTFTTPANSTTSTVYKVTSIGGGGGGGYGTGSGGGGGETVIAYVSGYAASTGIGITIGVGGSGGVASGTIAATAGGASTFDSSAIVAAITANGGGYGRGMPASTGNVYAGGVGGTGGTPGAVVTIPGGSGSTAMLYNASGALVSHGGYGGNSLMGHGGPGGDIEVPAASSGSPGVGYGGGGGGGCYGGSSNGGAGSSGVVIVEQL